MLFSERIRTLRRERKELQRDLAKLIGVDVPMYSRYEHGERRPKREQVVKLARRFEVDPGELVALWLAEQAHSLIAADRMADRASTLLLEQLGGVASVSQAAPAPQAESASAPVVEEAEQPEQTAPARRELPEVPRTLIASIGSGTMPHYEVGDALLTMNRMEDESVDCIVTTPPYWGLRQFRSDGISTGDLSQFVNDLVDVMAQAHRVLKPTGSLWLNMADAVVDGALQAVPWRVVMRLLDEQGWTLRHDVVWNKQQTTFDTSTAAHLLNVHEHLFHLVKSNDFYCDDAALRQAYSTARDNRQIASARTTGVIPPDVWDIAATRSEIDHYCVSPEVLYRLPIVATCPTGGLVLDPYCGTGTVCKVAYDLNRRSLGIDINSRYIDRALTRVEQRSLSLF